MTSINRTEGANRLRFESLAEKLKRIDTDIIHKVKAAGSANSSTAALPDTGKRGCFFQDELELCKDLETSSQFKRFYYAIWPLVQSLPELLHHQSTIVSMIEEQVQLASQDIMPCLLQLISVFAR